MPLVPPMNLDLVLRAVGFAIWQIQILEGTLLSHLIMVHEYPEGDDGTAREAYEAAHKKSLGELLGRMKRHERASPALVEQIEGLLKERNWLVHHSRETNGPDLYHADRTAGLLTRLESIADSALDLSKRIQSATESHLATKGVSLEYTDAQAMEIRRAWVEGRPARRPKVF